MGIKRLASTLIIAGLPVAPVGVAQAQNTLPRVVIEYTRPVYSGNFDGFMSQYFGGSGSVSTSFSFPEGEAFATVFAQFIIKKPAPKAALTMDSCAMEKAQMARDINKDSGLAERVTAARAIYFQNLPNFINTQKDGLIFAVIFGDGSQELYAHTSFYGVIPQPNTFVPGTGVRRC